LDHPTVQQQVDAEYPVNPARGAFLRSLDNVLAGINARA
jgi:hypothetical protein